MALRRQLDAHTVELDGDLGYARYWLKEPQMLDFDQMLEAAADASYTITRIQMTLDGITEQSNCEACASEVSVLKIPETGQRFELTGARPAGTHLQGQAEVSDWAGEHPRLTFRDD